MPAVSKRSQKLTVSKETEAYIVELHKRHFPIGKIKETLLKEKGIELRYFFISALLRLKGYDPRKRYPKSYQNKSNNATKQKASKKIKGRP